MGLHITFRKLDLTPALKSHITKKVEKFSKYVSYTMEIHVVCSLEKMQHCAEITCHAEHKELVALAKSSDLYESIDQAVTKMESQLKKERERRKGHSAAHIVGRSKGLKQGQDLGLQIPHVEKRRKIK